MPSRPPAGDTWTFNPNGTTVGDLGAKAVAATMLDAGLALESIDLSGQDISDTGTLDLATALMGDGGRELSTLNLDGNNLTDDGERRTVMTDPTRMQ